VFIPENNTENDRNIYINYRTKTGYLIRRDTLVQKCPIWKGDYGWETDDESNTGAYGFSWDRKVSYVYRYSAYRTLRSDRTKREQYRNYVTSFQEAYDKDKRFTTIDSLTYNVVFYRYYITIDYSKASTVEAYDVASGLLNTKALYSYNGGSNAAVLETVLKTTKKTENGKTNQVAFANGSDDEYNLEESGNDFASIESSALSVVLKKNKYNIKKEETTIVTNDSNDNNKTITIVNTSYSPVLKEADIVWYLPAVNQSDMPSDASGTYWSSTAASGGKQSYLVGGTIQDRNNIHKIRAVRSKN
jgi:hypothetical protein